MGLGGIIALGHTSTIPGERFFYWQDFAARGYERMAKIE